MTPPFKLVIVAATGTATKRTIPSLRNSRVCRVTAIHGRDPKKVREVGERFGILATYTDPQEMLRNEEFDVVFVASPPFLHLEDLTRAACTGKPVICEKPLARSLEEAREIRQVLERAGVPFMLAHHLRHQPAIATLRNVIQTGEFGPVLSVWAQWGFELNKTASNALWKLDPILAGPSVLYDAGVHVIDLLLHLFGRPARVAAVASRVNALVVAENVTALLDYGDFTVALNTALSMPTGGNDLLVYCREGSAEIRRAFGEASVDSIVFRARGTERHMGFPKVNLYQAEVENFVRHHLLGEGVSPGTSLNEAIETMEVLGAINDSVDRGSAAWFGV